MTLGPQLKTTAIGLLLLTACVPASPKQRGDIARSLKQRTGHALGPADSHDSSQPPGLRLEDGLSSRDAVALALWNNSELQAAIAQLGFAKADLFQAGAIPNPVFSLLLPLGPKQLEANLMSSISWIWQRPKRVRVARLEVKRVAEVLVQSGLDTVRNTRVAHAKVVHAQAQIRFAEQAAEIWTEIVRLHQVRVAVGDSNELELGALRIDARIAQVQARRALHDHVIAKAELYRLAALNAHTGNLSCVAGPLPTVRSSVDDLLKVAMTARPDLRASEMDIEAAGEKAGLAKADIFELTATLDANAKGTDGFEVGPGLGITLPIFNQNQAGRARAEAELSQARWNYVATSQRIRSEVVIAHAHYLQAKEALDSWPLNVLKPSEETLRLAKRSLDLGGTSSLVVLDATKRLIAARVQQVQLELDLRRAWAELSRSIGKDLDANM